MEEATLQYASSSRVLHDWCWAYLSQESTRPLFVMNSSFKCTFIMAVQMLVCINIGHAEIPFDRYITQTFEYIYDPDTLASKLREAKEDYLNDMGSDLQDQELLAQVLHICSGHHTIARASRPNQRPPVYPTKTVVACIFLQYLIEEAPAQHVPIGDFNIFWITAIELAKVPGANPEKEMRQMLEQDMKPKIDQLIAPENVQAFLQFCAGIINNRWDRAVAFVVSCSVVGKYWPIMFPPQG